jgi:hypothetical protein
MLGHRAAALPAFGGTRLESPPLRQPHRPTHRHTGSHPKANEKRGTGSPSPCQCRATERKHRRLCLSPFLAPSQPDTRPPALTAPSEEGSRGLQSRTRSLDLNSRAVHHCELVSHSGEDRRWIT